MGRAERRAYNKKHKTKLSRDQFNTLVAIARIQSGNYNLQDLKISEDLIHLDNYELVPEGCECKLNYEAIIARPHQDKLPEYIEWVEANKDTVLHVTRENTKNSLIAFREDERYKVDPQTNATVRLDPWLFDVYTDILVKNEQGDWVTVLELETQTNKKTPTE